MTYLTNALKKLSQHPQHMGLQALGPLKPLLALLPLNPPASVEAASPEEERLA